MPYVLCPEANSFRCQKPGFSAKAELLHGRILARVRWTPAKIVVLAAVAAVAVDAAVVAAAETPPPNVILCMADDQGWGDVGYNGHPQLKTPVLDQMAASALRLDRFYAAAPVCSPTRGSVMTGRHPNRYGCFSWGRSLRPEEITVAEAIKKAGYATGHFGKWHLGPVRAGNPVCPGESGFDEWISSPNFYENDPLMSHQGKVIELKGESSMATVEAALPFLRQTAGAGKPFLAVIWFGNPHGPHVPVPELAELYADQPPAQRNYLAEITGIDRAMGRLRKELDALGIRQNTLLWYTSDNGATGPGSTGGLRGKKGSLWEGGLRVPCVIEWPARIKSPRRSDIACGTVDIYPTILDLVRVTVPEQPPLDGLSLVPLLDGTMTARAKPLGFWVYPVGGQRTPSTEWLEKMRDEEQDGRLAAADAEWESRPWTEKVSETELPGHAAWLDGPFKLHRLPQKKTGFSYELYDLAADPKEGHDIAAENAGRVEKMKAELERWQKSVIHSLNGGDYLNAKPSSQIRSGGALRESKPIVK